MGYLADKAKAHAEAAESGFESYDTIKIAELQGHAFLIKRLNITTITSEEYGSQETAIADIALDGDETRMRTIFFHQQAIVSVLAEGVDSGYTFANDGVLYAVEQRVSRKGRTYWMIQEA